MNNEELNKAIEEAWLNDDNIYVKLEPFKEGALTALTTESVYSKAGLAKREEYHLLVDTAKDLIGRLQWQFTARNGRKMSIEDSNGEKCWIVPDEVVALLKGALEALPAPPKQ